jgi:hypothetical protein
LVSLHDATYFVPTRYRNMKAPIAVAACDWAGDAAAGQLIKGARRKHKRWPTSGLFVANWLQEVEPNDVARIGAIARHSPHLIAARWTPHYVLRNIVARHAGEQFIK